MSMNAKKIAGSVLAAALLTTGVLTAPRWVPEVRDHFTTVAAPRAVARTGWDYKGPDDPSSFLKDVGSLAKDRPLIVMLYNPGCEMCAGLTQRLHEVQDNHLSDLDFDVLRVDASRYSRIVWEMRRGSSTPECFVYCGSKDPVTMNEIPENTASLVDFLQTIYHKTGGTNASSQPVPRSP